VTAKIATRVSRPVLGADPAPLKKQSASGVGRWSSNRNFFCREADPALGRAET
jgi:hypothetical protein